MPDPRVHNIPPSVPFVDALARGLLARAGDDPLALADHLILLPTRRAARVLREAFLRLDPGKARLLPRMMPLGEIDPEELGMAPGFTGGIDFPPAMSPLRRQMLLTGTLIGQEDMKSPGRAAMLARDLAVFLDETINEDLDFDNLERLVPDSYAEHWGRIIQFLTVLTEAWPKILKAEGQIDPARRRALLVRALAARWNDNPPDFPVIAAGSTG
ncbi:MAG: double-strand break repair protein AddB, partial [Pseudomonadota bacterium]|nr:double-strand break repair protein AddB [Pseudomonadota bacterium]